MIVVSGDLIEGVRLDDDDFRNQIEAQYDVAEDLLAELVARFLDGDRSRLVMVPGNHDIDWNTAFAALERVDESEFPSDLRQELHTDDSLLRWDWKTQRLYRIVRPDVYAERLAPFRRFRERFYSGLDVPRKLNEGSDAPIYDLFDGMIGVAAFDSCDGNDCFAYHGRIGPESVARSDLALRDGSSSHDLRMAVWHHNIEGSPYRTDYMDVDIVRGMIGRGFKLGLHGHQHKAQAGSQVIRLPDRASMAVISAGSLCAGREQLPLGTHRQYNIVEIESDFTSVCTHVRAMAVANVFSRATVPEFGGVSYMRLPLTPTKDAAGQVVNIPERRRDRAIRVAEAKAKSGQSESALQTLRQIPLPSGTYERQLYLDTAEQANDWHTIVAATDPPTSIPELVSRVNAQCKLKDHEGATHSINNHSETLGLPDTIKADLHKRASLVKVMNT